MDRIHTISKVTNKDIGTKLVNINNQVPHFSNVLIIILFYNSSRSISKYGVSIKLSNCQNALY